MKSHLNIKNITINKMSSIMVIFWGLFFFFGAYEGYFPGGVGALTRYIIILWLVYMFLCVKSNILKVSKFQFIMIIWGLYYLSSLVWTENIQQAKIYVMSVILMVLTYVMTHYFVYEDNFCKKLNVILKIVSVSIAVLSIFFKIEIAMGTRKVLYLAGTYIDPNNQVAIIALGGGLCLTAIFQDKRRRILNVLGFVACCFSIFQCGSRSGIIILAFQVAIIMVFWHPEKNNLFKEIFKWLILLLLGLIVIYFMNNYISVDILDRLLGRGNLKFTDGTERERIWAVGREYFMKHPIRGNGWGTKECHNTFLTMLVDVGLLGNIPFYYLIYSIYQKAIKRKKIEVIMLLTSGLLPSFFIGAQNKRFFWVAITFSSILINCRKDKIGVSEKVIE